MAERTEALKVEHLDDCAHLLLTPLIYLANGLEWRLNRRTA